jgi:hypothetical protein
MKDALTKVAAQTLIKLTGMCQTAQPCLPSRLSAGQQGKLRHSRKPAEQGKWSKFSCAAEEYAVSSAHLTFNLDEEGSALGELGFLRRTGIQYHWANNGYDTFDSFLMDLKQSKRNNIRKVCTRFPPPCPCRATPDSAIAYHDRSQV